MKRHLTELQTIPKDAYVIRCVPGLARITCSELRYHKVIDKKESPLILRQRNHDLIFIQSLTSTGMLKNLRIPEQILQCIAYGRYKISESQLRNMSDYLKSRRDSFRVVVTADGKQFGRKDLKRWLSNQLKERGVRVKEDANSVLWIFCIDAAYYICIEKYNSSAVAFRGQRQVEREGSLPPTIAAAMAFLAAPVPEDIILDPVCGTGTLLAEAFAYTPNVSLIGIDIDPSAIAAAKANLKFAPRVKLIIGNSSKTDLPTQSVNIVLANLPFGKQYGDRGENPRLYRELLKEMVQLAVPNAWRAVLLTSNVDAFNTALKATPNLVCNRQFTVKIRGELAKVFLLSRAASSV
jgi:tRNA G10  N-methylase Trm11